MAITSYDVTCDKKKLKKHDPKSPYLTGDRVQLLSRVTEKRFIHKKTLDFVSSFPLAVNIYKANSDDFKAMKRTKKKNKKSVLTLPNKTSQPQICTVSDMNDSEYYSQSNDKSKPRMKKRASIKNVRKPRLKKDFELYDRDARYCSQLNIDFDSSFTDLIKNYNGDGKRISNLSRHKGFKSSYHPIANKENETEVQPHDVWAVLRNINRFQFNPSPPMSEEGDVAPRLKTKTKKKKKKKDPQNHIDCKDARVFETCRTEEFAFISSYQAGDSSRSLSQSSSFDRITVISKQDEFSKICKDFEERFLTTGYMRESNNSKNHEGKNKKKKRNKNKGNLKALCNTPKENNVELASLQHDVLHLRKENDPKNNHANCKADNGIPPFTNVDDSRIMCYSELTSVCSNNNKLNIENVAECSSDPAKEGFVYIDNPELSKTENASKEKYKGEKFSEMAPNVRLPTLNGISRVIFGRGREAADNPVAAKRPEVQKRKTRLVTTMPSACIMPKLTQTEIRRRVAAMRFPLVVLGKEQVSSSVEVNDYDPPQFDGLDQHVWPYMMGWSDVETSGEIITIQKVESRQDNNDQLFKNYDNFPPDCYLNKIRKNISEVATNKNVTFKNKRNISNDLSTNKNAIEMKRAVVNSDINNNLHSKKQTPMLQFKDKMLNLLYRKVSDRYVDDDNNTSSKGSTKQYRRRTATTKVDACTETQTKSLLLPSGRLKSQRSPVMSQCTKYNRNGSGYPWARAKWASDFIENVIKKIRNGAYYSQDQKCINCITETSIQTEPIPDQEDIYDNISAPKVTIKRKQLDVPNNIPGFENSLSGLEIKFLDMNQIAVRHCGTNIMMQFDVTVPPATTQTLISPRTSLSLIPIDVTDSHTKIFKCKTTILNAMLPAQLCSILPKMLNLFDSDKTPTVCPAICAAFIEETESHLSTITEITPVETVNISTESLSSVSSFNYLSPAIKEILGGMFSKTYRMSMNRVVPKCTPVISNDLVLVFELLPKASFDYTSILTYSIRRFVPLFTNVKENTSKTILPVLLEKPHSNSTTLELYSYKNKRLAPAFKPYDFFTTIRNILINQTYIIRSHILPVFNTLKILYDGKILNVYMKIPDGDKEKKLSVAISNMSVDNHCHEVKRDKKMVIQTVAPSKCMQYIKHSTNFDFEDKDQNSVTEIKIPNTKNKRRGFYRLYRKCKSVTNIPAAEKYSINTQLNKIQNLEDFFQILGSQRMISSIFDGYAARKILSSISEMKNWITEINPKQALLILLLTNKKDTPNLVRYRPILLQGIAVNRITRATELDMEIEVIERENLNKLSQYEGISYLPSSIQNQDSLLEELYWIAKTTASDYQRPFDESSERLLKSLLEKRKKLNPSYLRVMARYVGLGLLKSPTKK